jgi:hypothetical protein
MTSIYSAYQRKYGLGKEPSNLVVLATDSQKTLIRLAPKVFQQDYFTRKDPNDTEFVQIRKVVDSDGSNERFEVELSSTYPGVNGQTFVQQVDFKLGEINPTLAGLTIADDPVTIPLLAGDIVDYANNGVADLKSPHDREVGKIIKAALDYEHLTTGEVLRNPFQVKKGKFNDTYIAGLRVLDGAGLNLINARKAAGLVVRYNCLTHFKYWNSTADVDKPEKVVGLKIGYDAPFIAESHGRDAKLCLEDLVDLFKNKLGKN